MDGPATVPQRPLGKGGGTVSALAFSIDPGPAAPAADRETLELLRRSLAAGVTTFDVSGSRQPDRAERLLGAAGTSAGPLTVLLGRSEERWRPAADRKGDAGAPPGVSAESLESSLARSRARLPHGTRFVLRVEPDEEPHELADPSSAPTGPDAVAIARPVSETARAVGAAGLWTSPLSLLDHDVVRRWGATTAADGGRLIALDPFAGGRLDGTRFASGIADRPAAREPRSLRQLHAEFDPVLRLEFLTRGRPRTLAQASLEFALSFPWVATVVAPLPHADRLEEFLAAARGPGLPDADRDRVLALGRSPG